MNFKINPQIKKLKQELQNSLENITKGEKI